jgi:ADP-ribose pyrophosphatase YjhB (NUDIX family)
MTLVARGVVIGENDRVLLVPHSYVSGWHFPGGGVEIGETFTEALLRELKEEASVALRGEPVLHGIFLNVNVSRRDHIAVYVIREFAVLGGARGRLGNRRRPLLSARRNHSGHARTARRDI